MEVDNLRDSLAFGGALTRDVLIDLASTPPDGQVITLAYAVEAGTPGFISSGAAGIYMDVFSPDGTVTTLSSGAVTVGAGGIPNAPLEFAGKLGALYEQAEEAVLG